MTAPRMEPASPEQLAAAIDLLWQRFLPQTLDRVAILEAAAAACARGTLGEAQTRAAHDAAHKLAGSLGTFNLTRGSVLARELEMLYSPADPPAVDLAPQLADHASQLRSLIELRSTSTS